MKPKVENLYGIYRLNGNQIIGDNCTLLLVNRPPAKQTSKKTENYLLKVDVSTGNRAYVSSLYKSEYPDQYTIDYNRVKYQVNFTGYEVVFSEPSVNSFVYHRELVSKNENLL